MRALLLFFEGTTPWDSCSDINSSLLTFYQEIYKEECETFYVSNSQTSSEKLYNKVIDENFSTIIFIDHRIRVSKELYSFSVNPRDYKVEQIHFIFHIYGCFINRISEWSYIAKKISSSKVDFVAGSLAHARLVDKVLGLKSKTITLPFPIDVKKFDGVLKKNLSSLQISDHEKVLLYTGRISPGKNIEALCRSVFEYNKSYSEKIHLILLGAIDDMGWKNNKQWKHLGAMSYLFTKTLTLLNKDKTYIHYVPYIENKEEVYAYYKRADLIVSLSTMLNEDYGMAIADAIGMNKRILCSYWGGYKGFEKKYNNISFIKVSYSESDIVIDLDEVVEKINRSLNRKVVLNRNSFAVKNLTVKFLKDLAESKHKIIKVKKIAQFIENEGSYFILKNKQLRSIYDSYL